MFNIDACHLLQGGHATQEGATDTVGLQDASAKDVLTEILGKGAHEMLMMAIEADVDDYVDEYADHRDANGRGLVVRIGLHADPRSGSPSGDGTPLVVPASVRPLGSVARGRSRQAISLSPRRAYGV